MTIRNGEDSAFENVSSYSSVKEYKKKRKNKPARIVLKSLLALLCVVLIVFGAGLIYVSNSLFSELSTVELSKSREDLGINVTATEDDSIKNIAFFGVDSRDGTFSGLSDAIMIFTVDNKHGKIKITSILRDTRVDDVEGYGPQKINAAYAYGGADLAIKTLNKTFNLNIQDYVTINFYNLAAVVDAFGGTQVTLTDDEAYNVNKNLDSLWWEQVVEGYEETISSTDFLPDSYGKVLGGDFLLNGNQAVAYARNRSDSDFSRANRQKKVLLGLITRLKDMSTMDYFPLLQKIFPMCETSMSISSIMECAPILLKNITFETLNIPGDEERAYGGELDDGLGWLFYFDLENAAHHIDRFIYEDDSKYWDAQKGNGADDPENEPEWDEGVNAGGNTYDLSSNSDNDYSYNESDDDYSNNYEESSYDNDDYNPPSRHDDNEDNW